MPFIGNKPTAVPLSGADLEDNIITSAKITDGTIALADLSATGTKDSTTFLRGDNTFATAGGDNTPSFFAISTSSEDSTNISNNVMTKMTFSTEVFDTDSCYDNSTNYRFTPNVAGKYYVFAKVNSDNNITKARTTIQFYKNGSAMDDPYRMTTKTGDDSDYDTEHALALSAIIDMNGSTDYIEVYASKDIGGNSGGLYDKHFGAYKLIGV